MPVNTIMYHYVRNNENHPYDTYCRRIEEFQHQIDFFIAKSRILNPADKDEINYYLRSKDNTGYILTFDDGYIDHYHCAEYLFSKNCNGYFFPVVDSIKGKLLDVNAIHMIIGNRKIKINSLIEFVREYCLKNNIVILLGDEKVDFDHYISNMISIESKKRFDKENIIVLKRLLQRDIEDKNIRQVICNDLLKECYGKELENIVNSIYLDINKLKKMKQLGMLFGSHTNTHCWLEKLPYNEQKKEISKSIDYLKQINLIENDEPICMCYPYGSYNKDTLNILKDLNANLGFTTDVDSSKLDKNIKESSLLLSRWNTNDCWDNEFRKPIEPN